MVELQGPALLAFNNAKFSDQDFSNLKKLGGATKEKDVGKVGRFGLGFNAVYNLTDVPFISSGNKILILDPHSEKRKEGYLESRLKKSRDTGLTINLTKKESISRFKDQFNAFHNVCGFRLQNEDVMQGTLFRFPLRNHEQSKKSKLSKIHYDETAVFSLFKVIEAQLDHLLLFTQSVQSFSVSIINDSTSNDSLDISPIFSTQKKLVQCFKQHNIKIDRPEIDSNDFDELLYNQTSILKAANITKLNPNSKNILDSVIMVNISSKRKVIETKQKEFSIKDKYFLISSCISSKSALQMTQKFQNENLSPVGGVAIALSKGSDEKFHPVPLQSGTSLTFCFLPLPIENPFAFHVNGFFEVTSNRRELRKTTIDEKYDGWNPGNWNRVLMEDVIVHALFNCLLQLTNLNIFLPGSWHRLWPCSLEIPCIWDPLSTAFQKGVQERPQPKIFFSENSEEWINYEHTAYFQDELKDTKLIKKLKTDLRPYLETHLMGYVSTHLGIIEVDSKKIRELFQNQANTIQGTSILQNFFKNINLFPRLVINEIVLECLQGMSMSSNIHYIMDKKIILALKSSKCIFTHDDFKTPSTLIDPSYEPLAILYKKTDGMFPADDFNSFPIMNNLKQLGMINSLQDYNWNNILERVAYIEKMTCSSSESVEELSRSVIKVILLKDKSSCSQHIRNDLRSKKFLFSNEKKQYYAPYQMFSSAVEALVDEVHPIFDDKYLKRIYPIQKIKSLLDFLGINTVVQADVVHSQLMSLSKNHMDTSIAKKTVSKCDEIYKWFSRNCSLQKIQTTFQNQSNEKLILSQEGFKESHLVIQENKNNLEPWLFQLHFGINKDCCKLFLNALGVAPEINSLKIINILENMKVINKESSLNQKDKEIVKQLLNILFTTKAELKSHSVLALDRQNILRKCNTLYYSPIKNKKIASDLFFEVSSELSPELIKYLSIPNMETQIMSQFINPLHPIYKEFGQKVNLVTRLKNILEDYPKDYGIFKELIQNADDAEASEIHFIIDQRNLCLQNIFHNSWKRAQGPALLVYNNKPFSEKDFEGIQNIGLGSKINDSNKTGQYGIGFNSVYHITDVPSILSDDKTLAIMDPLCEYVPTANKGSPGALIDTHDWKNEYSDVYDGYLPQFFTLKGGTMFRLPLRIKDNSLGKRCSIEEIEELKKLFIVEAEKSLLFLKCLKKISFSTIANSKDTLIDKVTFCIEIEKDKQDEYENFLEKCKKNNIKLQDKSITMNKIPFFYLLYTATTFAVDCYSKSTNKWYIVQGYGTTEKDITQSLLESLKKDKMTWTPRVGVAVSLNKKSFQNDQKKIFCFLPIPVTTNLPVHINGHFAIDSSRRNLWQSSYNNSFQDEWNNLLLNKLIPYCYLHLMMELRYEVLHLEDYWKLFPLQHQLDNSWKVVSKGFFSLIEQKNPPIFMTKASGKSCPWVSVMDENSDYNETIGFFSNSLDPGLESILLNVGLPIINFTPNYKTDWFLQNFDSKVLIINPYHLSNFLLNHTANFQSQLPLMITDTPFQNTKVIEAIISYLIKDEEVSLENLPLNITQDGMLSTFNKKIYVSSFASLFPNNANLFTHSDIFKFLNSSGLLERKSVSQVFCYFKIPEFQMLFQEEFSDYAQGEPVLPKHNINWLKTVWDFISLNIPRRSDLNYSLDDFLALQKFSLIPAEKNGNIKWYPISYAKTIFLAQYGDMLYETIKKKQGLILSFQKQILKDLVAREDNPESMIILLENMFDDQTIELSSLDYYNILKYLNYNIKRLLDQNLIKKIKFFPIFKRLDDNYVSIKNKCPIIVMGCKVYSEIEKLTESNTVFLQWTIYNDLYKSLQFEEIDEIEFYQRFVLPVFTSLENKSRIFHLTRMNDILKKLLAEPKASQSKPKQIFSKTLSSAKLIEFNGSYVQCSQFFDHNINLFSKFGKVTDLLLPEVYRKHDLYTLMKHNGLLDDCSNSKLLELCEVLKKIPDLHEKKQLGIILLEFIFTRHNEKLLNDMNFWNNFSEKEFIIPEPTMDSNFIFTQLTHSMCFKNSVPPYYRDICFSTCNVLPQYAFEIIPPKYLKYLIVLPNPDVRSVIAHMKNLLHEEEFQKPEKKLTSKRNTILNNIYSFLVSNMNKISQIEHELLTDIPYVLVNNNSMLVLAKQVVQHLNMSYYYLYPCPCENWGYMQLFMKHGSTINISLDQIAFSLEMLYKFKSQNQATDSEKSFVSKVLKEILNQLKQGNKFETTKNLYLLSEESKFSKSTDLFIAQNTGDIDPDKLLFVGSLNSDEIRHLCHFLPENLKPKSVQQFTNEVITYSNKCNLDTKCEGRQSVYLKLRSKEFIESLVRLAIDKKIIEGFPIFHQLKKIFNTSEVICVQNLSSELLEQNKQILSSEKFIHYDFSGGIISIYIEHAFYEDDNFFSKLSENLIEILEEVDVKVEPKKIPKLSYLLKCANNEIHAFLDKDRIDSWFSENPGKILDVELPKFEMKESMYQDQADPEIQAEITTWLFEIKNKFSQNIPDMVSAFQKLWVNTRTKKSFFIMHFLEKKIKDIFEELHIADFNNVHKNWVTQYTIDQTRYFKFLKSYSDNNTVNDLAQSDTILHHFLEEKGQSGCEISRDIHWLLWQSKVSENGNLDFTPFCNGEAIGYRRSEKYFYAKIIEVSSSEENIWNRKFKIKCGDDIIDAHYTELFHFHDSNSITFLNPIDQDFAQKQVETIFSESDSFPLQKSINRMICESWSPERHPHDQATAKLVFNHVQNLIGNSPFAEHLDYWNATCEDVFETVNIVRKHVTYVYKTRSRSSPRRRPRQGVLQNPFVKTYQTFFEDFSPSPSHIQSIRPTDEYKVWERQAKIDFEASHMDNFNCWTVYKCYQAVEKLLKSVLFKEGSIIKNQTTLYSHNLIQIRLLISDKDLNKSLISPIQELQLLLRNDQIMRYPDIADHPSTPSDIISDEMTEKVKSLTAEVFQLVEKGCVLN